MLFFLLDVRNLRVLITTNFVKMTDVQTREWSVQNVSRTVVYPFTRFFTRCHRHRHRLAAAAVLAVLRFVRIIRHAPEWQLRSAEPLGRTRESVGPTCDRVVVIFFPT